VLVKASLEKKMSNVFEFVAENRDLAGKSAARAVRRGGQVPAVVYGGNAQPQSIVLNHNDVLKHLEHEAVYSHVLDLKIDGKSEKAVIKGVQRHPSRPVVLHMDFMRVDATQEFKVHVPLHFINEDICAGVKTGGVVTHAMVDVEISCLPAALPEYIEVDLTDLEIGDSIHLSHLILPDGLEIPVLAQGEDHDNMVAQVMKTKVVEEIDEEADSEGEGEEPSEEA
jgi:large subunit ribosomal protein L25